MTKAAKTVRKIAGTTPISAGLVLGSGLSGIGDLMGDRIAIPYEELKGFPGGKVSGHGRDLLIGTLGGKRVAVLTGREHYYENGNADAMRVALETLADLGASTVLLTNAAGSLVQDTRPGDLMMISDHPALRSLAHTIGARLDIALKEGIYLWYSGPSFETVAEIQMAIRLGAHAVGMSTAPEVIIARMLGLRVWACSSITNMGAGLSDEKLSHEHTKTMAVQGAEKLKRLIPALLEAI